MRKMERKQKRGKPAAGKRAMKSGRKPAAGKRTSKSGRRPGSAVLLKKAAEFIYSRMCAGGGNRRLCRDLNELGCGRKNCVRDYYIRKIANTLMAVLICAAALAAVLAAEHRKDRTVKEGLLTRPGYGERGTDQSLNLTVSGEKQSEAMEVHIDARRYTASEAAQLLESAEKELEQKLPGKNASPDEIRGALCMPESLQNGAVTAEYYINPSDMVDDDGSVTGEPDENGTLITITAELTCQDRQRTFECCAMVYPERLTPEEALKKEINTAVENAQTEDPASSSVKLPQSVDGKNLHWSYPQDGTVRMITVLLLVIPAALWIHEDSKVQDRARKRRTQLELDYSQLLWKMTMLLSAGLTIRGTFTKIAAQYETGGTAYPEKGSRQMPRYVYEEMVLTVREMRSGVPEAAAYENFGRRCGLPSYIKLGSLLSQNLKKGSKGLTALLEHEAVMSLEQHRMAAKKLGEKAGIRMLLPMIMMFGVVLAVLMVPALLSM